MRDDGSSPAEAGRAPAGAAMVLGGTGVVGHFLLPRLAAAGWRVRAVSRRPRPRDLAPGTTWEVHDVTRGLNGLAAAGETTLFHAAPLWLLPPLLAELAARGVSRVIAFSSTSRFTKQDSASAASRGLARALADAEDALASGCGAHHIAWTVFRPTLIYGAGLDRNVSAIARLARRCGVFPLAGDARGLRQPVHADDLARACLQAVDEPRTFGRAYDLTGGSTLTYREMVEQIFAAVGRHPRLPRVPLPMLRAGLRLARGLPILRGVPADAAERMNVDQAFDCSDARRDFGYAPRMFDAAALSVLRSSR
jgi:nucleoside-diphosphate-sugar epimerase